MAFVPATNVAQFNLRSTLLGELYENTLYFEAADGWTTASLAGLGGLLADWWRAGPRSLMVNDMVFRECYAVDLTTADGPTGTFSVANDPGGPVTSDPLPGNVALCVSFRTGFRGRSRRGRNYLSGFAEGSASGNTWQASLVTAIAGFYNELLTVSGDPSVRWVVVSRWDNGVQRTSALVTPVTAALVVDGNVDSMRRRLAGRGR